jgi:predicted outer membrane protein
MDSTVSSATSSNPTQPQPSSSSSSNNATQSDPQIQQATQDLVNAVSDHVQNVLDGSSSSSGSSASPPDPAAAQATSDALQQMGNNVQTQAQSGASNSGYANPFGAQGKFGNVVADDSANTDTAAGSGATATQTVNGQTTTATNGGNTDTAAGPGSTATQTVNGQTTTATNGGNTDTAAGPGATATQTVNGQTTSITSGGGASNVVATDSANSTQTVVNGVPTTNTNSDSTPPSATTATSGTSQTTTTSAADSQTTVVNGGGATNVVTTDGGSSTQTVVNGVTTTTTSSGTAPSPTTSTGGSTTPTTTGSAPPPATNTTGGSTQRSLSPQDQQFLQTFGGANLDEIEMGALALNTSTNPDVRAFGLHMVTAHGDVLGQTQQLAQQYGVALPDKLNADQQAAYNQLASLSGSAFDQQFTQDMINGHHDAINLLNSESQNTTNPQLQQLSLNVLGDAVEHLQDAYKLEQSGSLGSAAPPTTAPTGTTPPASAPTSQTTPPATTPGTQPSPPAADGTGSAPPPSNSGAGSIRGANYSGFCSRYGNFFSPQGQQGGDNSSSGAEGAPNVADYGGYHDAGQGDGSVASNGASPNAADNSGNTTTDNSAGSNAADNSANTTTDNGAGSNAADNSANTTTDIGAGSNAADSSANTTTNNGAGSNAADNSGNTTTDNGAGSNAADNSANSATDLGGGLNPTDHSGNTVADNSGGTQTDPNGNVNTAAKGGTATQTVNGVTTTVQGGQVSGTTSDGTGFQIQNGQLTINGKPLAGVAVTGEYAQQVGAQQLADQLSSQFPGLNAVRLATSPYGGAFSNGQQIDGGETMDNINQVIQALNGKGIGVVIDNHNSDANTPNNVSQNGNEADWFAQLARANLGNNMVMFQSENEPTGDPNAVAAEQQAVYNAVRGAGSNNVVAFDLIGGGDASPMTSNPQMYDQMSNYVIDAHAYAAQNADPVGAMQQEIAQTAGLTEADGSKVPVYIGETGNSIDGSSLDATASQLLQNLYSNGNGALSWLYDGAATGFGNGNGADHLTDANGNLTDFGQQIAQVIQQSGGAA